MSEEQQKTVLIVDDDKAFCTLLVNELSERGIRVLQAGDGKKGLDIALEKHPDLILLDILMPELEGTEVLKKIREDDPWGKNVPVLMLTQVDSMENIADAVESHSAGYLIKSDRTIGDIADEVEKNLTA